MYRDKAMRVTPRPMSNNKMESSPLIEEVYDSRRDVARRRGENGRVRGGTGGASVTRANREGVGSVRATYASYQSVFLMSHVDLRQPCLLLPP